MLHEFWLTTKGHVTILKVASWMGIAGVAHFVSQKETKRMAMHVCDMPNKYMAFIFKDTTIFKRKTSPVTNESVLR